MDRQEIFDKVANHLLTQNKKSMLTSSGCCLYRGPNGTKCAIGALIPDNLYKEKWDECPIDICGVLNDSRKLKKYLKIEDASDANFLQSLQSIHDEYEPISWESLLKEFAIDYRLEFNHG